MIGSKELSGDCTELQLGMASDIHMESWLPGFVRGSQGAVGSDRNPPGVTEVHQPLIAEVRMNFHLCKSEATPYSQHVRSVTQMHPLPSIIPHPSSFLWLQAMTLVTTLTDLK